MLGRVGFVDGFTGTKIPQLYYLYERLNEA